MIKPLLATGALCAAAVTANAQYAPYEDIQSAPGPYLGAALLNSDLDLRVPGEPAFGVDDWGGQLFVGYRVNPYVAIEGSWTDAGSFSFSDGFDGFTFDPKLFALSGVLSLPVAEGLSLFGRVSAVRWEADVRIDFDRFSDFGIAEGTDVGYGIGAQFGRGPLAARIAYDVVDLSEDSSDFELKQLSLGFVWKF